MLPKRLQRAKGPAKALANQRPWSFGRLSPSNGLFVIADPPSKATNSNGQVGIFCDGVRSNPARSFNGLFAPSAKRTRDHGNAIEQVEGALLQVLTGDVLERLPASEPARTVAHLHVAGYRSDGGIREMPQQFEDGVGLDFRVRIDGDDDFGIGLSDCTAQRSGLSAVGLMKNPYPRVLPKIRIEEFTRTVYRAVIHHDNGK